MLAVAEWLAITEIITECRDPQMTNFLSSPQAGQGRGRNRRHQEREIVSMKTLLFVCSGNAGRSPAAQYLAAAYISEHSLAIRPQSRGTNVRGRSEPDMQLSTAIPAAKSHVPAALDKEAIEQADLILTMNRQHKHIVIEIVPGAANKTYCLYEYAEGTTKAVVDPGDYDQEDYEYFLEEMKRLARLAVDKFIARQTTSGS
jgi:protein-tyrosine phosphatase